MRLLIACILVTYGAAIVAQSTSVNDPEAAAILERIAQKVQGYEDVTYAFSLKIAIPEQDLITQEGNYLQKGQHYRLEMPTLISMSDGDNQWLIDRESKEVQIHKFLEDDKENLMNPTNLLSIYSNPQFEYMLSGEKTIAGKTVQQIEFKPIDKQSEYAKARMSVSKGTLSIERVEVFSKDGTQYVVEIKEMKPNLNPAADKFVFQVDDFPNYHVEDLRID